jgi:ElaB/YqjD/DUF883 family membrane-anchored ribosome-binding protein
MIMAPLSDNLETRLRILQTRITRSIESGEIEKKAFELKEKAETLIKKHPIESLVVGALLGFVIGKILSGSDDE